MLVCFPLFLCLTVFSLSRELAKVTARGGDQLLLSTLDSPLSVNLPVSAGVVIVIIFMIVVMIVVVVR